MLATEEVMQTASEKPKQTNKEMVENVKQSTASALQALQFFHRSLVQARLPHSIQSYRTMCDTLVGQRIWMLDKNEPEVLRNFEELSQIAQSINDILGPYVNHLDKLVELGADNKDTKVELVSDNGEIEEVPLETEQTDVPVSSASSVSQTVGDSTSSKILALLRKNKKKISFTKIRSDLKLKRNDAKTALDKLVRTGDVVCKQVGGREMYELVGLG